MMTKDGSGTLLERISEEKGKIDTIYQENDVG